jgi:hypothetical protein
MADEEERLAIAKTEVNQLGTGMESGDGIKFEASIVTPLVWMNVRPPKNLPPIAVQITWYYLRYAITSSPT